MRKILALFLLSMTSLGIILIALTLTNKRNNVTNETILSINRSYFYTDNKIVNLRLYSNSNDSFLIEYHDYEAYLCTLDEENVIKVDIIDSYLNDICAYKEQNYFEYIIKTNVNMLDLHLNDCFLKVLTGNNSFIVQLGSLDYYEFKSATSLSSIYSLYGLSFSSPFTSIGAVCLSIKTEENDLKISNICLPDGLKLGVLKVDQIEEENVDISDIIEYSYLSKKNGTEMVETKSEKETKLLLLLNYEKDILYDTFPIYLEINNVSYFIDSFDYIRLNDLNLVEKILYKGEFSGIYSE